CGCKPAQGGAGGIRKWQTQAWLQSETQALDIVVAQGQDDVGEHRNAARRTTGHERAHAGMLACRENDQLFAEECRAAVQAQGFGVFGEPGLDQVDGEVAGCTQSARVPHWLFEPGAVDDELASFASNPEMGRVCGSGG